MRIDQLARRYPLPAIAMTLVLSVAAFLGIKVVTPTPTDAQTPIAAQEPAPPVMLAAQQEDSPFTTWQTTEAFVEEPESPEVENAPSAPAMPSPDEWGRLAALDIEGAEFVEDVNGSLLLPQPAGFDESMNPFERERLISSQSVERARYPSRGPTVRVGVGGGMGGCK